MFYGALKGRVDVLDLLQKAGSEIDLVDHNGETPIFYSLKSGSERALKWFVNKNVDLNKINTANKKLIQKAASKECKIAAAVDLLWTARRPLVITGRGVRGAGAELRAFLDRVGDREAVAIRAEHGIGRDHANVSEAVAQVIAAQQLLVVELLEVDAHAVQLLVVVVDLVEEDAQLRDSLLLFQHRLDLPAQALGGPAQMDFEHLADVHPPPWGGGRGRGHRRQPFAWPEIEAAIRAFLTGPHNYSGICIDTADWVLFTRRAASVKLPQSAMAQKLCN